MSDSDNILSKLTSMVSNITGSRYPTVKQKSTVDGREYYVRDLPDKQEAANLLAKLRMNLGTLMDELIKSYPDKPQVQRLSQNFKPEPKRFLESTPNAQHTSYSVNKGESVHLCLRQRKGEDESLVNENVMTFVALHEMAHTITATIGHGPDFWNNFGWLLKEAEVQGIYKHQDFAAHPVSYCGVKITDSPTYDAGKDGENLEIGTLS